MKYINRIHTNQMKKNPEQPSQLFIGIKISVQIQQKN